MLTTFTLSKSDYASLAAKGVPFVIVERADGFDHVHTSDYAAAFEMTTYLLEAGYGSVARPAGPAAPGAGPAAPRLAGYRAAMRQRGLRAKARVVRGEFTVAGGHKAMVQLLESEGRPRAVFCANDLMALGAIEAARAYGLRVPDDLAVAGFDDIHAASLVWPALTTVGHSAGELGAKAAGLLLDRMSGGKGPRVDVEVGFELKKRESA